MQMDKIYFGHNTQGSSMERKCKEKQRWPKDKQEKQKKEEE